MTATNTAIEVDLYAHCKFDAHHRHQFVNGLGGSGDFERNAHLSLCPSTAKGGRISTIVPMCSHIDHSEHSVQVVVTEQGLADLRGLAPLTRARRIIETWRIQHTEIPYVGIWKMLPWATSAMICVVVRLVPELSRAWSDAAGIRSHHL